MRTHRAKGRIKNHLKKRSESISELKRDNKREREFTDKYIKRLHEMQKKRDKAVKLLKEIRAIVRESNGIIGYHLNGDVADWDELDAFASLDEVINEIE